MLLGFGRFLPLPRHKLSREGKLDQVLCYRAKLNHQEGVVNPLCDFLLARERSEMELLYGIRQMIWRQMRVDHRRLNVRMPHQLLDGRKIDA